MNNEPFVDGLTVALHRDVLLPRLELDVEAHNQTAIVRKAGAVADIKNPLDGRRTPNIRQEHKQQTPKTNITSNYYIRLSISRVSYKHVAKFGFHLN